MTLLRELGRRKLRTTLTILGITIGIWALVVFSSMANKINGFVASGSDHYLGRVIVSDGSSTGMGIGLDPIDLAITGRTDDGPAPELRFDGADMTRLSNGERTRIRAKRMGFVFQSFNLVPTLTAVENVMLALDYADTGRAEARRAAVEALAWVGLGERQRHRPMELSGREQQRVALARALVNEPSLVLADEPTGNLDSARSAEVLDLLRRFNTERGQTTVIVTHDPVVAASTDRVMHMQDGLIADAPPMALVA